MKKISNHNGKQRIITGNGQRTPLVINEESPDNGMGFAQRRLDVKTRKIVPVWFYLRQCRPLDDGDPLKETYNYIAKDRGYGCYILIQSIDNDSVLVYNMKEKLIDANGEVHSGMSSKPRTGGSK